MTSYTNSRRRQWIIPKLRDRCVTPTCDNGIETQPTTHFQVHRRAVPHANN